MAQQDACDLLDEDHVEVERMFLQYKSAHDDGQKRVLTQRICHALRIHVAIENEVFYPAFRAATRDAKLVDRSEEEHDEALALVSKLEQAHQPEDRTMLQLEDVVLDHVKDERTKMFPEARRTPSLDLMALASQLQARKAELEAAHPA